VDIVLGLSLQKSYFSCGRLQYIGEEGEVLLIRLKEYFEQIKGKYGIYFTREIHQINNTFFREVPSHSLAGTQDIEIVDSLKKYPMCMINTYRYNAFYLTELDREIRKLGARRIYLVGVETHTNILFTAEELRNREYEVTVLEPLVVSQDAYMHAAGINLLSNILSVDVE